MRRPLALLLFASLLCAPSGAVDASPEVLTFPGKRILVGSALGAQRADLAPFHPVGETLSIGEHTWPVAVKGKTLVIKAGSKPQRFERAGTAELSGGKGKDAVPYWVHVRPSADGKGWEYANATAIEFDLSGAALRLIDTNADGRYEIGKDGWTIPLGTMAVPLTKDVIVDRSDVTLDALAPDGSKATIRMKALDGSPRQLTALTVINTFRVRHGLPPARIDQELSAACTAHAKYLEANSWSGYSNPHLENPEKPGYTKAGAAVAAKSLIMQANIRFALDSFFRTYYHRYDLLDPSLARIGVADGPRWIVVVDAKNGVGEADVKDLGWDDPILSPADGQTRFSPAFCNRGEAPEPVDLAYSRGNPLIANFTMDDRFITKFVGRLVQVTPEGDVPVPTMSPDQAHALHVFGVVPEKPLERDSVYRIDYTYEADEKPESATATFRTR